MGRADSGYSVVLDSMPGLHREGSVCLNSFGLMPKWISTSFILPPGLASAR